MKVLPVCLGALVTYGVGHCSFPPGGSHTTMEVLLLHTTLLLYLTYSSAAAENVSGDLHSPLNLTTSFSPYEVKDVFWNREVNGTEIRIAEIKNGSFVEDNSEYGQYGNGTVLEIKDLMEKHQGSYTADVTFLNNTMKKKSFDVSVRRRSETTLQPRAGSPIEAPIGASNKTNNMNRRNPQRIGIFFGTAFSVAFVVILVVTLLLILYRKYRKKLSVRTSQDGEVQIEMSQRLRNDEHAQEGTSDGEEQIEMLERHNNNEHAQEGTLDDRDEQELKEIENHVHQNRDINNHNEGDADKNRNEVKKHKNKDVTTALKTTKPD